MNITDSGMWPTAPYPQHSTTEVWMNLIHLRSETFDGFARIEESKGLLRRTVNVNTSHGQDLLRILWFRVLEECAESYLAVDIAHQKEEAIDAMNYLMSTALIDQSLMKPEALGALLAFAAREVFTSDHRPGCMRLVDLGAITKMVCGDLADTFRNRAWTNEAQDIYFAGLTTLINVIKEVAEILFSQFDSFSDFWQYYVAKDNVLKFRLATNY